MSEKIKIAVVANNEKQNIEKREKDAPSLFLTQKSSVTLMPVLLQNHLMNGSFCGGRGDCGRCVVQFLEGAPLPTGIERARLTPEELRQGYRLACVAKPKRDCMVRIVDNGDIDTPIVTEMNLPSENIDLFSQEKKFSENQKSAAMESGDCQINVSEKADKKGAVISNTEADVIEFSKNDKIKNGRYIIGVDLGTTTIAMQLRDMATGETSDTYCEKNPQRIYGTDVLARIEASCNGKREELQRLVCEPLARGLRQFAALLRKKQGGENEGGRGALSGGKRAKAAAQVACMCIAGNTTMEHLLLGFDVEGLGRAPFVPVETGLQKISVSRLFFSIREPLEDVDGFLFGEDADFPVYLAPCISAFVGGDIVAGLYALHMLPARLRRGESANGATKTVSDAVPKEQGEKIQTRLLIDLGTNGEMAITDGSRMIVTATAAGPAFEGHGDLIGTDRIAFTADLLRRGLLDETGLLAEPYFQEGVPVGRENKNKCYFKQEDIRNLQMAKAAVRAGVEILWKEMGCPEINEIYLAGGFGYYLDVEAAFAVGLLPQNMRGMVRAVGNTSLAGAYELGCGLMEGKLEEGVLEKNLTAVKSINLAKKESFEALYLKYMNLEGN